MNHVKFGWWKRACALCVLCAAAGIALPAQTYTELAYFDGSNGADPVAGLVQGTDGNFYGTTAAGGANDDGTVFKITPSGTVTTMHSFDSTDGGLPFAALVQATNGDFYGTTNGGGVNGGGTVFKIIPSGTLTTLYSFCSQSGCADGELPKAALVQGTDGNFYGTTVAGGANGQGTVFEVSPSGTLTTLHSFDGTDGESPAAALVQATNGNFYGTTEFGGASDCPGDGCGTVFKITPSGTLTTLHSFDGTDGESPAAALVQATNGNFYGTTEFGGTSDCPGDGCGTVFKITPSGTLTLLHSFDGTDGDTLAAGLVQAINRMGQRPAAGLATLARSSKSPQAAR